MIPEVEISIYGRRVCQIQLTPDEFGAIQTSQTPGRLTLVSHDAILSEALKVLMTELRIRRVGLLTEIVDWDDLQYALKQLPKPWDVTVVRSPKSNPYVPPPGLVV